MQDMLRRQFGRIGFLWNRALAEQAAAAHRQAGAHAHVIGDDGRRAFGLGGQSVGQRSDMICQGLEFRP